MLNGLDKQTGMVYNKDILTKEHNMESITKIQGDIVDWATLLVYYTDKNLTTHADIVRAKLFDAVKKLENGPQRDLTSPRA